jgi:hypothetical protein
MSAMMIGSRRLVRPSEPLVGNLRPPPRDQYTGRMVVTSRILL